MKCLNYDNSSVRRQDRLLEQEKGEQLLQNGEWGVLSMVKSGEEGPQAYGLPINFVWDREQGCIYLHCAPEGEKLRAIEANPMVSFAVVGRTNVLSAKFTTEYESVVLKCRAEILEDMEEKRGAMVQILKKYSPDDLQQGLKMMEHSLPRTGVIRLEILHISGKCKRM